MGSVEMFTAHGNIASENSLLRRRVGLVVFNNESRKLWNSFFNSETDSGTKLVETFAVRSSLVRPQNVGFSRFWSYSRILFSFGNDYKLIVVFVAVVASYPKLFSGNVGGVRNLGREEIRAVFVESLDRRTNALFVRCRRFFQSSSKKRLHPIAL